MESFLKTVKFSIVCVLLLNSPSVGAYALQNTTFTLFNDNNWTVRTFSPQIVDFVKPPKAGIHVSHKNLTVEVKPIETSLANGLKPNSYIIQIFKGNILVKTASFSEKHDKIEYSNDLTSGLYKLYIYGKAYTPSGIKVSEAYQSELTVK